MIMILWIIRHREGEHIKDILRDSIKGKRVSIVTKALLINYRICTMLMKVSWLVRNLNNQSAQELLCSI